MDDDLGWLLARRRGDRPRDPRATRALLDAVGCAEPPAAVQVVGTNGKGTVAYALAAMATAHGHVSGRFTSPHVESVGERVAIDGVPMSDQDVIAFARRARAAVARGIGTDAGFFEWTLAMALERFSAAGVTLAVVEAGVGARGDATSALRSVRVGVLTNVSLDHQATLGATIRAIALEKSAVVRRGGVVVTAASGTALRVLRTVATQRGAALLALADGDPRFELPASQALLAAAHPPTHLENLRVACAAGRVLGFDEGALEHGCLAPPPPGRFERFHVGGRTVVLDGAHDPAAARRLAAALPNGFVLVFGALARKQGPATFAPLARRARWSITTRADPEEACWVVDADERLDEPVAALERALGRAGHGGLVVVAGSLHLIGRLRPTLRRLARADPPARPHESTGTRPPASRW